MNNEQYFTESHHQLIEFRNLFDHPHRTHNWPSPDFMFPLPFSTDLTFAID